MSRFKQSLKLILFFSILFYGCKKNSIKIETLTLQPANNPSEVAIAGNNSGYEISNPNWVEVLAEAWTKDGNPLFVRNTLKFDLSSIPSSAIITSAKLTLYSDPTPLNGNLNDANYGTNDSLLIQQITTPWNASSAIWANQPTATATNELVIDSTTNPFLDLLDLDVKGMVSSMIKNNTNYGFLIRLKNENTYNSRIFCSSRYADSTKHPKLMVVYTIQN